MSTHPGNESGGREAAAPVFSTSESASQRAALYRLLATLFRQKPDRQMMLALRRTDFREALSQAGMTLDDDFFAGDLDALVEALAVEFSSLFLLPGSMVSPHESVQIRGGSGLLRGPETARVRQYYEHVGFAVDPTTPMEPDHVSIELEFLAHLAGEEATAREFGRHNQALDALRYQDDFLRRHLGQWAFDFFKRVEKRSRQHFYRELARLASDFLMEQRRTLPPVINRLQADDSTA